ncbi:TlyA family rRNA (cytidine-2'-O)-methyltransferase [Desulfomarina profundi]|uniref:TlyA family rRNA (Cytidine-2'-O)-methyltransferase n=1 Tax=Desulfomarina profundi TaxID=2772557 RepID=A0A8D5FHI1_9BACT|nr:TlyA family RNA methyltransferase [Desulfomarina profundi]BCL60721.1 TlyA family rRNA (cytidine-2'-O)-methyltransferase [Desulfomarina profundi]
MKKNIRLDQLLVQKGLASDLDKARAMIGAGEVLVDDTRADKAGFFYPPAAQIRIKERIPYVSRGGLKLEKGLDHFKLFPQGKVCIDIGASSGGFTDCLLQHGADKVYAVDVAYGQLSWKLRQDKRVVILERFNARNITPTHISETIDLGVMDVSFISITKLIPPLITLFSDNVTILTLIKPQFELTKDKIPPGGVIKDPLLHQEAIQKIDQFVQQSGLKNLGCVPSPVLGPKGNTEFLMLITT